MNYDNEEPKKIPKRVWRMKKEKKKGLPFEGTRRALKRRDRTLDTDQKA